MPELTQDQIDSIIKSRVEEVRSSTIEKVRSEYEPKLSAAQKVVEELTRKHEDLSKTHQTVTGEYTTKQTEWQKRESEFQAIADENKSLKVKFANIEFEDKLVAGGVKKEHASDMRILLTTKGLLVDDKGQPKEIDKVLEVAKASYAPFFAGDAPAQNRPSGTATPGNRNTEPLKPHDPMDRLKGLR